MILKGNRRSGAKDLAVHLMKAENEHVEVHELRGFVSRNLLGALTEIYALSRGTRCQKFMYSMSVNPPAGKIATKEDILRAIEDSEKTLGLKGQPRAIVFHEKKGRRHAHVVWSLINAREMKAVRLRNDRTKLQPLTRQLFIRHGWDMPKGLLDKSQRDPRNYDLKEYHKAKKTDRNAGDIKAAIQTAWAISDSRNSFKHALEERGFKLAAGDRAAIVAVDMFGEVHSVPRALKLKVKDVRSRLGDERKEPEKFLSVEKALAKTASMMLTKLSRYGREAKAAKQNRMQEFETRRAALVKRQQGERAMLTRCQQSRWVEEWKTRQARFRSGFMGLWDRMRGEHGRIKRLNEQEATRGLERDKSEQERLVQSHLGERNHLQIFKLELRKEFQHVREQLQTDRAHYTALRQHYSRDGPGL